MAESKTAALQALDAAGGQYDQAKVGVNFISPIVEKMPEFPGYGIKITSNGHINGDSQGTSSMELSIQMVPFVRERPSAEAS